MTRKQKLDIVNRVSAQLDDKINRSVKRASSVSISNQRTPS